MNYAEAKHNVVHFMALGQKDIWIDDESIPLNEVTSVIVGGGYRYNGPTGVYLIAEINGVKFRQSLDFEHREANGQGYSAFDAPRLRDVLMQLPRHPRNQFIEILRDKVLPDLTKRTEEMRASLHRQWSSEDLVRGLIAIKEV